MSSAAPCRIKWWDNNGLIEGGNITYSSQQASFPFSNALNDFRSKVWSPAGNFEITGANNNLYVGGSTVTLSQDSYIPSSLAAELQNKLNGVDSGWTVTYNTTLSRFELSNAAEKTLNLSTTTNAIWDTIGFTGTTDRVASVFPADEQRNHTSEWIQIDFGTPFTLSCASIIGLLDEKFPLSSTAEVRLRGNNVDLWTAPPLDRVMAVSPRGTFAFIDDLTEAARTFRYARIEITDRLNSLGPTGLRLARAYIGDHTSTDINISSGFSKPVVDPSTTQRSDSGVAYFEEKIKYQRVQGATYGLIGTGDRVYLEQLYQDFGKTKPLFVSLDPLAKNSTDLSEFTYYGHFDADPTPRNLFLDKWSFQFNFREAV